MTQHSPRQCLATVRIRALRYATGGLPTTSYDRQRDLPRLLPLLAEEVHAATIDERRRLVSLLRRALRAERMRAHAWHWTYSPSRHAALLRATRAESIELQRHKNTQLNRLQQGAI